MDPKTQLSGLDPKLKEAYERVMGTSIPPPQEPAASAPTSQTEPASPAGGPSSPPSPPSNEPPKEPVSPPPIQEPVQEPTQQPPPPVAPPQSPQPPEPAAPPLQEPELPPIPPVQPPVAQNEPVSSAVQPTGFVANAAKKGELAGLKLSRPILMAIGAAFLVLYIFFWMRIFNLSLF